MQYDSWKARSLKVRAKKDDFPTREKKVRNWKSKMEFLMILSVLEYMTTLRAHNIP